MCSYICLKVHVSNFVCAHASVHVTFNLHTNEYADVDTEIHIHMNRGHSQMNFYSDIPMSCNVRMDCLLAAYATGIATWLLTLQTHIRRHSFSYMNKYTCVITYSFMHTQASQSM